MRVLAINASPNSHGLTAACAEAFLAGAQEAGAEVKHLHLCCLDIQVCQMCEENGWGDCRAQAECRLEDDFQQVREAIFEADLWVLATPVYYGEPSENSRALLDRLRRCNSGDPGGALRGKDFVGIVAAGGSGRGTGTCSEVLERIAMHMGMRVADLIGVTRRSKSYKIDTIKAAGAALASQKWEE